MKILVLVSCLLVTTLAQDTDVEGVIFPSGQVFYPVDEDSLDQNTKIELADPKNTSSFIYEYDPSDPSRKFTLNVYEKQFKSPSTNYYRAHPAFAMCLQKIYSYVQSRTGKTIKIASGYQTSSDAGSDNSSQALYARSGCGATITYHDNVNGDLLDIARGAIHHCLNLFGEELRDLGVIMLNNGVHVHMTGPEDVTTHFSVDGFTGKTNQEFNEWAWDALDTALDPVKPPHCVDMPSMGVGENYPSGEASPESVVGRLDKPVTRDNHDDFKQIRQFAGSRIKFEGCSDYLVGNAPESRCSSRLLSPRLYNSLRMLQKTVIRRFTNNKLKVEKAWTEDDLTAAETDLHKEGRAAQLKLSQDNTADNLASLAQEAVCAGLDYVENKGDHVLVAVRKQASMQARTTSFDDNQVLHVLTPAEDTYQYDLDTGEDADFPLLDSADQDEVVLGEYAKLGQFKSATLRYLRLDPLIARCYDSIMRNEAKWNEGTTVQINVVSSFLGSEELDIDERGDSPGLGQALQLIYDPAHHGGQFLSFSTYNIHRMARVAVQECAPIFFREHRQMGLGFYDEGLFIDMRDEFTVWQAGSSIFVPPGMQMETYIALLEDRYYSAVEGRTINPTNPTDAEGREVIPEPQSPEYEYEAPKKSTALQQTTVAPIIECVTAVNSTEQVCEEVQPQAVVLQQYDPNEDCVPQSDTDFCEYSKADRELQIAHIWKQIKRKHMLRKEDDIKNALERCFGACGTCVKGYIYEEKTRHCDNLLHWMPFRLLNSHPDVTTMYQKDNYDMHDIACSGQQMCIYNSPLYAILGTPLDKLFRRFPDKSIEEELYGANDNPLPIYELVLKIHAIEAQGRITVYVQGESEIRDLRSPLKVAMVYNKKVTFVQVYVYNENEVQMVERAMQTMVSDWVANTHTAHTREAVVPFDVAQFPSGIQKRSLEDDFHTKLMSERRYFERHWLSKQFN